MAVLNAYLDESGKHADNKVVALGGVCASPTSIHELEECWNGLLRRYGMSSLHMKEALRLKKPLGKAIKANTAQERIDALKPFADCIRRHVELGLSITIDVGAYAAMSVEGRKRIGGSEDPHYLAFLSGMLGPVHYSLGKDYIHVICDDDEATALNCYRFYRRIRKVIREAHDRLAAISFARDEQFPSLQAADFVASLIRMEAHLEYERRPYDYRELFLHLIAPNPPGKMIWGRCNYNKQRLSELSNKLEKNPLGSKETFLRPLSIQRVSFK